MIFKEFNNWLFYNNYIHTNFLAYESEYHLFLFKIESSYAFLFLIVSLVQSLLALLSKKTYK